MILLRMAWRNLWRYTRRTLITTAVLLRMAWRNLWRYKRRTLITAAGMAMAMGLVLGMSCMQDGMFDVMADVMVRQTLGHVQVAHPDWPARQLLYDTIPETTVGRVGGLPGVSGASGRLFVYGLAASDTKSTGARFVGVNPVADKAISDFGQQIERGRFLRAGGEGEVVIGEAMAIDLELKVGDKMLFLGQAADGSTADENLKIVGTFSTGNDQMDRSGAYLHLSTLQTMMALEEQVHQVLIIGEGLESSAALKETVSREIGGVEGISVRSWQEAAPATAQLMNMRDVGLYLMLFIVFTVAGLAVLNTMLMTVFERTCELGVLRALGMGRLQMMLLVVFECILLTAVATLIGLVIGGALDWLLLDYGFPYEISEGKGLSWQGVTFPPVIKGLFRIEPVIITVVFMNMVAVVAAVWPAIRAARLRPVEAMRQN